MEIILSQRFNFSIINSYKDHSFLSNKFILSAHQKNVDEGVFGFSNQSTLNYDLPPVNKKNVYYFTGKEKNRDKNDKLCFISEYPKHDFYTTDDELIKKHYGRPFSQISTILIERTIVRRDDKITIKIYKNVKSRKFNCKHFKKSFSVTSLTINTKTGNFTSANISKSGKASSSVFRTNSLNKLGTDIIQKIFSDPFHKNSNNEHIHNLFEKQFDNNQFLNEIIKTLELKTYIRFNVKNVVSELWSELLRYFVEKKEIKIPNGNWMFWINNFYPTEKYLKKNDRKLLSSVLDMFKIKSKVTVKLIHEYPNIDLFGLYIICNLFGENYTKYIANIDKRIIANSTRTDKENTNFYTNTKNFISNYQNPNYVLLEIEKENLLRVINSTGVGEKTFLSTDLVNTINDHFNMIKKIREFDPNFYMRSKNALEFHEEHRELSKIISAIKKGWVITYEYSESTIKDIEKPIESHYFVDDKETIADMIVLYPHILKREEEYSEEGSFMHHCVATYSDKDTSIIISIRNDTQQERVTCEFDIQTGECIQTRYFCNGIPPKMFQEAILVLKDKVRRNAKWGTLNWKEKKKVPIMINGKEVDPNLIGPSRPNLWIPDEIQF